MRLTNPLWYLLALLVALAGSMVGTAIAAGAWDGVREATVSPNVEPVDAGGHALAVFTDQHQPARDIECSTQAVDDPEAEPKAMTDSALDLVIDSEGARWHLIALDTSGSDDVTIACLPADDRPDNASYGYAVVDGFDAAARGRTTGMLSLIAGLALAVATFVHAADTERPPAQVHETGAM